MILITYILNVINKILINEDVEFDADIKECTEWLQQNIAPWGDVLEKWHKTYEIRMNELDKLKDKNLAKIFDNWPLFKHPQGYELIDMDFKIMNMTKVELNIDIWMKFFKVIREQQPLNSKDSNVQLMMQHMEDINITNGKRKQKRKIFFIILLNKINYFYIK